MNLAVGMGCGKPGQPLWRSQEELGKVSTQQSRPPGRQGLERQPATGKAPPASPTPPPPCPPHSGLGGAGGHSHLVTRAEMMSVMVALTSASISSTGPGMGSCWQRCSALRICCRFCQMISANFSHLPVSPGPEGRTVASPHGPGHRWEGSQPGASPPRPSHPPPGTEQSRAALPPRNTETHTRGATPTGTPPARASLCTPALLHSPDQRVPSQGGAGRGAPSLRRGPNPRGK